MAQHSNAHTTRDVSERAAVVPEQTVDVSGRAGNVVASAPEEPSAQLDFGWADVSLHPYRQAGSSGESARGVHLEHGRLDVHAQQQLLHEAFPAVAPEPAGRPIGRAPTTTEKRASQRGWRRLSGPVLKTVIGLAIVGLAGWMPIQRFIEAASTEAIVNAQVITIRAPIEGEIAFPSDVPDVGSEVNSGRVILRISNRRADRTHLDDLRRLIDLLKNERTALAARLQMLKSLQEGLAEQTRAFQRGRVSQLEKRVAELESQIAAAKAMRAEAVSALLRTSFLAEKGIQTPAARERAERDEIVAAEADNTLQHRLAQVTVELDAARRGTFVGDSYNDRPSSSQHADDVAQRIAESTAELQLRDDRLNRLQDERADEERRYADQSDVELAAPVSGTMWEMLTAPGEQVRRGQDLLRILDCSKAVVSAAVSERVYSQLRLSDRARFRFSGEDEDHAARVIRLAGPAAPPDNLAISSLNLMKDLYRVTVAVELNSATCAVGRTGKVLFGSNEPTDSARSVISGVLAYLVRQ